jgi:hypothetical protein
MVTLWFAVHLEALSIAQKVQYQMAELLTNNEIEKMCQEVVEILS